MLLIRRWLDSLIGLTSSEQFLKIQVIYILIPKRIPHCVRQTASKDYQERSY